MTGVDPNELEVPVFPGDLIPGALESSAPSVMDCARMMLGGGIEGLSDEQLRSVARFVIDAANTMQTQATTIQELEARNAELLEESQIDHLTRLKTRKALADSFDYHGRKAAGERRTFVCMFVDVNKLKTINDKFGHVVGDDYLLSTTDGLLSWANDDFDIIRWGGDEFSLVGTIPYDADEQKMEAFEESYKLGLKEYVNGAILDTYQPEEKGHWAKLRDRQKKKYEKARKMLGVSVGAVFVAPHEIDLVIEELDSGKVAMDVIVELVHDEADKSMYHDKQRDNASVYREVNKFSPFIIRSRRAEAA